MPLDRSVLPPSLRHEITDRQICDWIVETCLTFGTATHTAYKVAGLFIEGVRAANPEDRADAE